MHLRVKKLKEAFFFFLPQAKVCPSFLSSHTGREITHPPRQRFFENLVPLAEREDYECID